jgi:hypothetical protein
MQPGNPDSFPDRRLRKNGEQRPRTLGLLAEKQSDRAAGFCAGSVEDLAFLAQRLPAAFRQLIANEVSRRRLEWADLIAQIIGQICGLAALLMLAAVSWHAIDCGDATQGASIICTGAVSIVALFVTGRLANPRYSKSSLPEPGQDEQAGGDRG